MKYILNSSVITSFGKFDYRKAPISEAKSWLSGGGWENTIRYQETCDAFESLFSVRLSSNPKTIKMNVGDEALVFRLVFPKGFRPDPSKKGRMSKEFILENCEIGFLTRTA